MTNVRSARTRVRSTILFALAKGAAAVAFVAPLALAACQDSGFDAAVPPRMAPGVPIAVESIEGPPDAVQGQLNAAFDKAAAAHQVSVVDESQTPRYRLKGYVTAAAAQDGKTALTYVWDVFDADNRRTQRVTGVEETAAADPNDPWSGVNDSALQHIASKSMDGIADFLADAGSTATATAAAPTVVATKLSPSAITGGGATGAAVGADGKSLSYAPSE